MSHYSAQFRQWEPIASSIFVLDGKLELLLDGRTYLLTEGDYACIPDRGVLSTPPVWRSLVREGRVEDEHEPC